MGGEETPPMDSDSNFENDVTLDFGENTPNDNVSNENLPTEFDSNFDAGVEADEETDPKKYIQQLTGKLSQTLNSYNNENGEPDTELGKYVLGMLVKQGTKGMDEKDRKEIIKKINIDNSSDEDLSDDDMSDKTLGEHGEDEIDNDMNNIKIESKTFSFTKKQIFENFGIAINNNEKDSQNKKEPDTKISADVKRNKLTKPFEAPKKFK